MLYTRVFFPVLRRMRATYKLTPVATLQQRCRHNFWSAVETDVQHNARAARVYILQHFYRVT